MGTNTMFMVLGILGLLSLAVLAKVEGDFFDNIAGKIMFGIFIVFLCLGGVGHIICS